MTHRSALALRSLALAAAALTAGCLVPSRFGPGPGFGAGAGDHRQSSGGPSYAGGSAQVPGVNGGPAACQYALSQGNPLITEWPASE
jgi:hypothetical protein